MTIPPHLIGVTHITTVVTQPHLPLNSSNPQHVPIHPHAPPTKPHTPVASPTSTSPSPDHHPHIHPNRSPFEGICNSCWIIEREDHRASYEYHAGFRESQSGKGGLPYHSDEGIRADQCVSFTRSAPTSHRPIYPSPFAHRY